MSNNNNNNNNNNELPLSKRSVLWGNIRPFALGGMSACMATTIIQPIDMVKVRIQLSGEGSGKGVNRNPLHVARNIIKSDGFFSLYRGLSAALLRQMTYGMTRLGVFRTLTNKYKPKDGTPIPMSQKVLFSLIAGGTGALVGTPADAALVRMQADSMLPEAERRGYKNAIDALMKMARQEGLKGFFSGAAPTIYRGLSINVGMLSTYDTLKRKLQPYAGNATPGIAGFISGWTAATVSLPFDFIKTRLQKQKPGPDGKLPYKNFIDCVRQVAAKEGAMSFYNGYTTYVGRITPHILLTWVFLELWNNVEALK